MDFNAIIQRVIAFVTNPTAEWGKIKNENTSVADLFLKYAIFLAAIQPICMIIGQLIWGYGFTGRYIIFAILLYVLNLVGIYVFGMVLDFLAPNFGSQKDLVKSMKVAVYSSTPAWVGGVFFLIFSIRGIGFLLALYGLYLLYLGIKLLKETPQDKIVGYLIVSIIVYGILFSIAIFLAGTIIFGSAGRYIMQSFYF